MTQGYRPGGGCRSCGTIPRKSPRSPGPFLVVSNYNIWTHGHNPSNTSCDPWPPGQLGTGRLPYRRVCTCVAHGKHCRLSSATSWYLSCQYIFESCAWSARARSPAMQQWEQQQWEQQQVRTTLEPDVAPETAVLLSRPPKPLLEHPPKSTNMYMLLSRRKSTKCVQSPFCGFVVGFPGLHKTPAEPKSRPPNLGTWPSKPKTSFWTKIHDYALLRLEDAAVSYLKLLIPKLYFEAKTPLFTPFLYRSTGQSVILKKNLNASKPSNQSKGLGGNIGCRVKNSTWYWKGPPMESHKVNSIISGRSPRVTL